MTNCLSPTNVSWQAGAAGVGSGTAVGGTVVGNVISTAFDLNGDFGINDLVMASSTGATLVALGSSSGYGSLRRPGSQKAGLGTSMEAELPGFLVNGSGTWWFYKKSGSTYAGSTTGISYATASEPTPGGCGWGRTGGFRLQAIPPASSM